jgi:hypothetical protein
MRLNTLCGGQRERKENDIATFRFRRQQVESSPPGLLEPDVSVNGGLAFRIGLAPFRAKQADD